MEKVTSPPPTKSFRGLAAFKLIKLRNYITIICFKQILFLSLKGPSGQRNLPPLFKNKFLSNFFFYFLILPNINTQKLSCIQYYTFYHGWFQIHAKIKPKYYWHLTLSPVSWLLLLWCWCLLFNASGSFDCTWKLMSSIEDESDTFSMDSFWFLVYHRIIKNGTWEEVLLGLQII